MSRSAASATTCRSRSTFSRRRIRSSRRAPIPLPEAQLDRFLLQIDVAYPDREAERRILIETTGRRRPQAHAGHERRGAHERAAPRPPAAGRRKRRRGDPGSRPLRPPGGEGDAAVTDKLLWGPGPRASQALMLAVRARALIEGRDRALDRGRDRPRRAGTQAPHGADLRGPRRRRDHFERHRPPDGAARLRSP